MNPQRPPRKLPTLAPARATVNPYDDVEITARGPRGGEGEWLLMFSRLGRFRGSYRHSPTPGYVSPDDTPASLVSAAVSARYDAGVKTPLRERQHDPPAPAPRQRRRTAPRSTP